MWVRNVLGWGQMQNTKRKKGRLSNGGVGQEMIALHSALYLPGSPETLSRCYGLDLECLSKLHMFRGGAFGSD